MDVRAFSKNCLAILAVACASLIAAPISASAQTECWTCTTISGPEASISFCDLSGPYAFIGSTHCEPLGYHPDGGTSFCIFLGDNCTVLPDGGVYTMVEMLERDLFARIGLAAGPCRPKSSPSLVPKQT